MPKNPWSFLDSLINQNSNTFNQQSGGSYETQGGGGQGGFGQDWNEDDSSGEGATPEQCEALGQCWTVYAGCMPCDELGYEEVDCSSSDDCPTGQICQNGDCVPTNDNDDNDDGGESGGGEEQTPNPGSGAESSQFTGQGGRYNEGGAWVGTGEEFIGGVEGDQGMMDYCAEQGQCYSAATNSCYECTPGVHDFEGTPYGDVEEVQGCTDPNAENYNSNANSDDGSCEYMNGCTDENALNYDSNATADDGSCFYLEDSPCYGVTCEEGETCIDGECVSTPRYEGRKRLYKHGGQYTSMKDHLLSMYGIKPEEQEEPKNSYLKGLL